jgi:hypothetical protein
MQVVILGLEGKQANKFGRALDREIRKTFDGDGGAEHYDSLSDMEDVMGLALGLNRPAKLNAMMSTFDAAVIPFDKYTKDIIEEIRKVCPMIPIIVFAPQKTSANKIIDWGASRLTIGKPFVEKIITELKDFTPQGRSVAGRTYNSIEISVPRF